MKILFLTILTLFSLHANIDFTQEEREFISKTPIVTIGSIDSYTPFSFISGGEKVGFTQDIIEMIRTISGLQFTKVGGTWPEVYGKFSNGEIDIITELSYKKERLSFTHYTKPYFEIPIGVFTRDDFTTYSGIESLQGKKVGIVKNSYLVDVVDKIRGIEVVEFDSTDERFYALKDKRVDAVLSNAMSMYQVEKLMLQGIKMAGLFHHPEVVSEDLRFGININQPILASIINKSLDSIPYSTLSKLQKKWILQPKNKINLTPEQSEYLEQNNIITMCIDPNWMPFESFDQNGKHIGMSAEYYKIFEEMLPAKFEVIHTETWGQSLEFAQKRKCDILSLAMETPERKKYMNFTTPYLNVPLVVATNLNVPFINDIKDLEGKRVGINKGYAFVEILRMKYPQMTIIEVEDIDDGLQKVLHGELFGFIGTLATVAYKFQTDLAAELKIAGKLSDNWELGIGVRNDDPILFDILQTAINNITFDQKREILNNWISVKYEEGTDYTLLWKVLAGVSVLFIIILYFFYKEKIFNHKLQLQKDEFETIFHSSKDGIAIVDLEYHFLNFNEEYIKMSGYTKEELDQLTCLELTAQEDQQSLQDTFSQVKKVGFAQNIEKICLIKGGGKVYVNMSLSLMPDKTRILLVIKNITQQKQLESQSKLASMGEMLANIAHQWRQPLSVISTAATGMKLKKNINVLKDEEFDDFCDIINENAQYLSQTIDDFRNFIKGDRQPIRFNLKNDTDSFIKIVNTSIKNYNIQLILELDEDIEIQGYPNELIQCFINIFNNAKDAFVEKNIDENKRYIFISQQVKGNTLTITFKDNAGGIPKEIAKKIFEPYFTTKHQSQGTGLGLHMAYNIIVNRMGGTLEAINETYPFNGEIHSGAKFVITLPIHLETVEG